MKWYIWIILVIALFLRIYRVGDLTGFYFDQGRDAKIVWDLWHSHQLFLIGPTTGIEGIFLGPFYYYLIAPFYLLGNGNPVIPAVALAVINLAGIYIIYLIGKKYFDPPTGLIAAFFLAFSFPLIESHRWLSNPTPLPFFSALAVLLIFKLINGTKSGPAWFFLGLILGLSLQLEAASAVFFLPATALILLIYRRRIVWGLGLLHLSFGFCLTIIPQLWFNFRHDNLLADAFAKFLITDRSFVPVLFDFYLQRLAFYFDSFTRIFFIDRGWAVFFSLFILLIACLRRKHLSWSAVGVLGIWIITPLLALLFYHGNHGYVWGYYFTGVYPLFVLLVAYLFSRGLSAGTTWLWPVSAMLLLVFVITNQQLIYQALTASQDSSTAINLGTSLAAVDWVYADSADRQFNVDVYVPPVIPHAYDYLFLWRGNTRYRRLPSSARSDLLYLVYESDPSHPERLSAWLDRQAAIASSAARVNFGGVTVERRYRFNP